MSSARFPLSAALAAAVGVGVLTAVQARVNGQLGVRLNDGVLAAAVSFGSGLLVVAVVIASTASGRRGFGRLRAGIRTHTVPWWMLTGGAAGALTVATQGLTVGIIGVSLFSVGVIAGQTLHGLVLDRIGYGPAGIVAVTIPRVAGAALALGAVALSLTGGSTGDVPWWMLVLPFIAGAGIAWQQATNGRLRKQVDSAAVATFVNFLGGTIILVAAAAVNAAVAGPALPFPGEPWLYLGGVIGVVYIFTSAAIVASTGVLLLGLGAVVGQLVSSVILDVAWPTAASPGPATEVAMVTLALASVLVTTAPWKRIRRVRR